MSTPVLRNVAIVAHVDHGKTTLVDAMLRQTGAVELRGELVDRVLDSGDLEREKGITILAKNIAVHYGDVTINIVDTPGHADFGGEVERALAMVDGVLLLVDAAEGPLPQTRFVLRKTLERRLPVVVVLNKVDRPDARPDEVVHEVEELFLDLDADEHQISFPVLYASAREGWASATRDQRASDLTALFQAIVREVPPPPSDPRSPLQALVCNLDASPYMGRLALVRVVNGSISRGETVAWCRTDGQVEAVKVTELYRSEGLERVATDRADAGDIVAVAGIDDITIGETLADLEAPIALPPLRVDEPNLAMTIGINTSPLAGRDGSRLTARVIKSRLDQELVGNVSIRVRPTERPDAWEVLGRGELQLAILVETMRREGFELTVGKPSVITKLVDGVRCEPMERVTIDVPDAFVGAVTTLLSTRKGELVGVGGHGSGWVRMDWRVPARGLVGVRTEFLTETRGTGVLNHESDGYAPWLGALRARRSGAIVADRAGVSTGFALMGLQERGELFVGPGTLVYEGMIVGVSARPEEMDVNVTKEKQLTNMRSSTAEVLERMTPPTELSLEQAIEFIADDECVEVTPRSVRLRKVELSQQVRGRARARARRAD